MKRRIIGTCIILFLLFLLERILLFNDRNYFNKIVSNYGTTQGWIVYYLDATYSDANTIDLKYRYCVNNYFYDRKITINRKIKRCDIYGLEDCGKIRFWVIYSKDDPSLSLINYYIEIQDIENPVFPKTLDNFE